MHLANTTARAGENEKKRHKYHSTQHSDIGEFYFIVLLQMTSADCLCLSIEWWNDSKFQFCFECPSCTSIELCETNVHLTFSFYHALHNTQYRHGNEKHVCDCYCFAKSHSPHTHKHTQRHITVVKQPEEPPTNSIPLKTENVGFVVVRMCALVRMAPLTQIPGEQIIKIKTESKQFFTYFCGLIQLIIRTSWDVVHAIYLFIIFCAVGLKLSLQR